jgi:3-methyl-2-oxobutanoate hydroxymethyltransferase
MKAEEIKQMKSKEKITVLTCYGYSFASILSNANIDIILVGDSLGNVVLGYDTTQKVTMQDMIRHTQAVRNGAKDSFIVTDMPYSSDETQVITLDNAKLLLEAGADAVKVEGKPEIVEYLVDNKVQVMGHIGHLPQTAEKPTISKDVEVLLQQAKAVEKAGAFAIVLELVKSDVAKEITSKIKIPTIGIGAGKDCDGQVLVINDMLGLYEKFTPKFVKKYANLAEETKKAVKEYISDVKQGKFPDEGHSFE